jgi:hypothetical protein
MTITDKQLKACAAGYPAGYLTLSGTGRVARELLAARKVVRMTRELAEGRTGSRTALTKALDAYDKARKGKP